MMKITRFVLLAVLVAVLSGCGDGSARKTGDSDALFQTSTITALLAGVYDGDMTLEELTSHGDFGLGTFDALDGEMVLLEGKVYQIKADGKAYAAKMSTGTPFAAVKFFHPDIQVNTAKTRDLPALQRWIDAQLPTVNIPYAIKIEGMFRHIKVRSVPAQQPPYPRLVDVIKNQPTFELNNVRGTIVGFRLPSFVEGVNVPGYHFHFLTEDRSAGGHVLACRAGQLQLEADRISVLKIVLPTREDYYQADLAGSQEGELDKVEKD